MANVRKRGHGPADPWDLVRRHFPDHHGVPLVAGLLMAQNGTEAPDNTPVEKIMNPRQELFFLQAEILGQGFKRGRRNGQISLSLTD